MNRFLLVLLLVLASPIMAQIPLALPAAAPVASAPTADGGAWLFYADGGAARVELRDVALVVRQVVSSSPTKLTSTWKDQHGMTHTVETSCAGITLVECTKRHDDAVQMLAKLYPAQP